MKETCGCCEGIHKLTPMARVNRPGLSALSYRVGTHGSFLETMKSRLSSLEFSTADFDEGLVPTPEQLRPLWGLTTRAASDPAIAMLDAWAAVADVLTFYQERIANEGFLITATERRSILELARLIGYRLRPGVAASVFLAYSLEKDNAVEIPAGARAQSVPGPGDLPQSFETSETLKANANWNELQVRLTRPLVPDADRPLYFKGTSTNLKPNDPLLIDPSSEFPTLLRVLTVEPDQIAGRTRVTHQPWTATPRNLRSRGSFTTKTTAMTIEDSHAKLQDAIDHYVQAEGFDVNTATQTAQRVMGHLTELRQEITSSTSHAQLKETVDSALIDLRAERDLATEGNFTKLLPWINNLVTELEQFSEEMATASPDAPVAMNNFGTTQRGTSAFHLTSLASHTRNLNRTESTTSSLAALSPFIKALEAEPSSPPANSRSLDGTGTFSPSSDVLPKVVVAMRPALRDVFYRAWGNVEIRPPVAVNIYALRARASVFGHNAPLKPTLREGKVVGTEEWTLFKDTISGVTEKFELEIVFSNQAPQFNALLRLLTDTGALSGSAKTPPNSEIKNGQVPLVGISDETATLTLSNTAANTGATLTLNVNVRNFQVVIDWRREGETRQIKVSGTRNCIVSVEPNVTSSLFGPGNSVKVTGTITRPSQSVPTEIPNQVSLDASYKEILPGSWVVIEKAAKAGKETELRITEITGVREASRADYGITAPGTQLELDVEWISPGTEPGKPPESDGFEVIRGTRVFAQSELLELAEEPIDPELEPVCGSRLELANLVNGLEVGRWLIVSGERIDVIPMKAPSPPTDLKNADVNSIDGTMTDSKESLLRIMEKATGAVADTEPPAALPGITSSEVVMLAGVEQGYDDSIPGDKTHTTLLLAKKGLAYCYKRDTVKIFGNVVKATHGETKSEVLGSGDGAQDMQQFTLHQSPLTYLAAATPAGAVNTLEVRVNDMLWHETENLVQVGPKDRRFATSTDDKDQTTVEFGNGRYGARLPTGVENVKAVYRVGIGQPGNVKAEQISSVVTKPLGVKSVINPLPATGGANREDRDQARRNAPLAVMALDRLVSVQDYEDFARTYAGLAKASAARLSDGRRQLVHLTIAGSDDIPIDTSSDLFLNLRQALNKFGDPYHSLMVVVRKLKLLVINAQVRLQPDYQWVSVEPIIRAALLDKFSFARRELGQHALASEALSAIQGRKEVAYVDLDTFDSISEDISTEDLVNIGATLTLKSRIVVHKAWVNSKVTDPKTRIQAAELAYLSPSVAETLILTELKG